jgi:hypothetical protein
VNPQASARVASKVIRLLMLFAPEASASAMGATPKVIEEKKPSNENGVVVVGFVFTTNFF